MLVHQICENNALKIPARVALISEEGDHQTWDEFNQAAEAVADLLYSIGVRKGDRVAVLARNCLELMHIYIGCSKLGAIYAPANYRFTPSELADVLHNSEPRVIIVQGAYATTAAELAKLTSDLAMQWLSFGGDVAGARRIESAMGDTPNRGYAPAMADDDISWICYTGGTTGRSKGVMLSHRNILANCFNWGLHDHISPDDVYLAAGPLFHVALTGPIAYWVVGAPTIVMNFEPTRALDLMEAEGVTKVLATGTIFKMLVDEMETRPRKVKVQHMNVGGAPVSLALVEKAMKLFNCGIGQIYGQTEVTLTATYLYPSEYRAGLLPDAGEVLRHRLGSVGRAAPLSVVRVVDPAGPSVESLAPGVIGEIAVMGPTAMLGYWKMPELTAQTICEGWVRSGDLGWMDEDGYIYLVDRKKDMIISGGENVYSAEVELVLLQHPRISEAVVIGVPDEHWGERVHAVVVTKPGEEADEDEIRSYCRLRLAGYKVPKAVEFRAELPRMPTGKIAKGALRAEYWQGQERRIHGI